MRRTRRQWTALVRLQSENGHAGRRWPVTLTLALVLVLVLAISLERF